MISSDPTAAGSGKALMLGMVLLVLLAAGLFVRRGPVRAVQQSGEFAVLYGATKAWAQGANPYDAEELSDAFLVSGGSRKMDLGVPFNAPLTFPLFAPLSFMPWNMAKLVWLTFNIALLLIVIHQLLRMMSFPLLSAPGLGLVAMVLAMAPLHTGMAVGQTQIVVAALLIAALRADLNRREIWLGIILGIIGAVKPQMLVLFGMFYLCRQRWVSLATASIVLLVLSIIGIGWLELGEVDWWVGWTDALRSFAKGGGLGDPTAANEFQFQMINLHYPMHLFIGSRVVVGLVVPIVSIGLAWYAWTLDREATQPQPRLVIYSLLVVATLMMTYHRSYDAFLLFFPVAVSIAMIARHHEDRRHAIFTLILTMVFLAPGAAALHAADLAGYVPAGLRESWVWRKVLMPHQAWTLLALAIWLIWHAPVMVTYTFGRYSFEHHLSGYDSSDVSS